MLSTSLLTLDVILHYRTSGTPNSYNQPSTGTPSSVTVKGYLRPLRTNTTVTGGEEITSDASMIVQPLDTPTGIVSVEAGGRRYNVDGEPVAHVNPISGQVAYHQIYLRRGVT